MGFGGGEVVGDETEEAGAVVLRSGGGGCFL